MHHRRDARAARHFLCWRDVAGERDRPGCRPDEIGRPDLVLIGADDPGAMVNHTASAATAASPSRPTRASSWPASTATPRQLIVGAKYLFTNEYEWGLLQQKTGLSADDVASDGRGPDHHAQREGRRHRAIRWQATIHVDVVPVHNPVDPTGVGDGFRRFLSAPRAGSFERAAQLGLMVAALVLECDLTQGWSWDTAAAAEKASRGRNGGSSGSRDRRAIRVGQRRRGAAVRSRTG